MDPNRKKQLEKLIGILDKQDFYDFYNGLFEEWIQDPTQCDKEIVYSELNSLFGRFLNELK